MSFSLEVTSLPLAGLEVSEAVVGTCSACGHAFKSVNKEKVFKFMDRKKLAYRRPKVKKNLAILFVPLILIMMLALTAAAFAAKMPDGWPSQNDSGPMDDGAVLATPTPTATVIVPTPVPVPSTPLAINGAGRYDAGRGKYSLPVSLSSGSSPVDLRMLTVTVRMNNRTITPNAWEYDEYSCQWITHNATGSTLGPNDTALLVVDMGSYNFENDSVIYLDFKIPDRSPLTVNYTMNRTNAVIPLPPVIYNGEYDYVSGKMIDVNDTNVVKVYGRVFVNKWPATNMAISFYDNYTTTTVTSVEDGFYTAVLKRNQTYHLKVWSSTYGTAMQDPRPRVFMNDTALDIKMTT